MAGKHNEITEKRVRLALRPQYREPLRSEIGFFGRQEEVARLLGIFKHRNSATVLVSGHRGVGKTSLIDEALRRQAETKGGKPRLVARLALPHLTKGQEPRDHILKSLARALYFTVRDAKGIKDPLRERVEALYKKTFLRELEEQRVLGAVATHQLATSTSDRRETTLKLSQPVLLLLSLVFGGALGLGAISVLARIGADHGTPWLLASAALLVALAVASGVTIKTVESQSLSATEELTALDGSSHTGSLDISSETIEFELREVLADFAKAKQPCIFVLDELDKLEIPEELDSPVEQHTIFRIVASLKNFFSLGEGIFVFISGDTFYRQLERDIEIGDYALAHTVFTDRIFIHALHYEALESLIDHVLEAPPLENETYRKFRNFLCWESGNHAFDLLYSIGDLVRYEDETPYLLAELPGEHDGRWREGNLPPNWETAAGLQKLIGAVYDEFARPGIREELFNQRLWRILRFIAGELYEGKSVQLVDNAFELPEQEWLADISSTDEQDLAGAVERLLVKLERYAMGRPRPIKKASPPAPSGSPTRATQEAPPDEPVVLAYRLLEKPSYPPGLVGREAEHTPFEKFYLDVSAQLTAIIKNLRDQSFELDDFEDRIVKHDRLTQRVRSTHPRETVPRSQVSLGYEEMVALGQELVDWAVRAEVADWAKKKGADISRDLSEPEPRTGEPWGASLANFQQFTDALEQQKAVFRLIGGSGSENQLMVLLNPSAAQVEALSAEYSQCLSEDDKARERRKQRLPVVAVQVMASEEEVSLPQEVVAVLDEADSRSFVARLMGNAPKKVKKRQPLIGWHVFALDPLLENVDRLLDVLEEASYIAVPTPEPSEAE